MIDRKTLRTRISDREERIEELREQAQTVLANLGQAVLETGARGGERTAEYIGSVSNRIGEISDLEEKLERIRTDEKRREELKDERKDLNLELRNIRNRSTVLQEDLGRGAWNLWKSGRVSDRRLEAALGELIEAEERLRDTENALYRNEREAGGKTMSILSKGRMAILSARRKHAIAVLERLFGRAGARIVEEVPAQVFDGTQAAPVSATLATLDGRVGEVQDRIGKIEDELEFMKTVLEGMPGSGGYHRRAAVMEKSLERLRDELDAGYRLLGGTWLEESEESAAPPVEERRLELTAIREQISEIESQKAALGAHLEYLEIMERRDRKAARAAGLEEEIRERQVSLKGLKRELTDIEKELSSRRDRLPELPVEE